MKEIDYATAQNLVSEIIAEYGDDVIYEPVNGGDCQYMTYGAPSCIVGHVLSRFGVDMTPFETSHALNTRTVDRLAGIEMTASARQYLQNLQALQDRQVPWGDAAKGAQAWVEADRGL